MPYLALSRLIDEHFDALSPELQRAARWVRDHPAEMGLQSLRASARAAGVAPATLSRLSQALGLDGFEAMRRPVIEAMSQSGGRPAGPAETDPLADAQHRNVESAHARNTGDALIDAADALLRARSVLFLGLRASHGIAHHLRYACDWLRPGTQLAGDMAGTLSDQVAQLEPEDLLVAVSQAPYTRTTVDLVRMAQSGGVPVLALTDSALSPLARGARHVLLFEAASPSFFHSMTGAQALAERLVAAVAGQGGAAVVQRLARMQQRLHDSRTYFEKRPSKESFS